MKTKRSKLPYLTLCVCVCVCARVCTRVWVHECLSVVCVRACILSHHSQNKKTKNISKHEALKRGIAPANAWFCSASRGTQHLEPREMYQCTKINIFHTSISINYRLWLLLLCTVTAAVVYSDCCCCVQWLLLLCTVTAAVVYSDCCCCVVTTEAMGQKSKFRHSNSSKKNIYKHKLHHMLHNTFLLPSYQSVINNKQNKI